MSGKPRACYCELLWSKSPELLESQGVPRGFCALCHKCRKPGHLRHFPGAVPYTGGWCEAHYFRAKWLHPLGSFGVLVWFGVPLLATLALWWLRS